MIQFCTHSETGVETHPCVEGAHGVPDRTARLRAGTARRTGFVEMHGRQLDLTREPSELVRGLRVTVMQKSVINSERKAIHVLVRKAHT